MELKGKVDLVSRPQDGCAFMHRRMFRCQEQTRINLMAPASSYFVTIVSKCKWWYLHPYQQRKVHAHEGSPHVDRIDDTIEALDGVSTDIFVEIKHRFSFPKFVEKSNLEPIQDRYYSTQFGEYVLVNLFHQFGIHIEILRFRNLDDKLVQVDDVNHTSHNSQKGKRWWEARNVVLQFGIFISVKIPIW